MNAWFLYLDDAQQGPFDKSQIKELIDAGKITGDCYVFDNNSQNWVLINQIDELKNILPEFGKSYYFYNNDTQIGPLDKRQISDKLISGELSAAAYIYDAVSNQWLVFGDSDLYKELQLQSSTSATSASAQLAQNMNTVNLQPQQSQSQTTQTTAAAKKVEFPCKNHPLKESYLMCPECGCDYCEDCLVNIGGRHYCKECYAANKEKIDALSAPKSGFSFFSNLFKKKK